MSAYCERADLTAYGIRADALRGITTAEQDAAIAAVSSEADGYLGSRYTLPLTAWSEDLTRHVAKMAVYDLLVTRGLNGSGSADDVVRDGRADAVQWLYRISQGAINPRVTDSSGSGTAGHVSGGAKVVSFTSRGYAPNIGETGGAFTGRRS